MYVRDTPPMFSTNRPRSAANVITLHAPTGEAPFMARRHNETHRSEHSGWLRAAVLGANDGIISVASLMTGIATSEPETGTLLLTGIAGLVAGAMSMAAGEYVSVRTQADTETADMAKEIHELETEPARELAELTAIYVARGLEHALAAQVARQLTAHDALAAHARDELGITETLRARPVQAALASAAAFATGAAIPILAAAFTPAAWAELGIACSALLALFGSGAIAGHAGGASPLLVALRVSGWGVLAMGLTSLAGRLVAHAL